MFRFRVAKIATRIVKGLPKAPVASTSMILSVGLRRSYRQSLTFGRFCTTAAGRSSDAEKEDKQKISVTFVDKDGEENHIKVPVGNSMLEAAHDHDIELEGACEGSLACSTCHLIVMDMEYYNKLEENDMLDLAFGLTETSRLVIRTILATFKAQTLKTHYYFRTIQQILETEAQPLYLAILTLITHPYEIKSFMKVVDLFENYNFHIWFAFIG